MTVLVRRRLHPLVVAMAAIGTAFVAVPLLALLIRAPWGHVGEVLTDSGAWTAFRLSLQVSLTAAGISALFGLPVAWVLARGRFRGRNLLRAVVILPIVLPPVVGGIALLEALGRSGVAGRWLRSALGIQLPFTVFLYTGFIRSLPADYTNAALIDGASHLQAFGYVIFPLLRPITGTVLILNAVHIWNDFFTPLLYLGGSGRETVPVRVFAFVNEYTSDYGLVAAGLVLAALPILVVFLVLQRYVIRGFSSGLKG